MRGWTANRRKVAFFLATVGLAAGVPRASAGTWSGGGGNNLWGTALNWDTGWVPIQGEDAGIPNLNFAATVLLNVTTPWLNYVNVGNVPNCFGEVVQTANVDLNAMALLVGRNGASGAYTQTAGNNVISQMVMIGSEGGTGTYNLNGGSLSAGSVAVGRSGTGHVNQSNSTLTVDGTLAVENGVFDHQSGTTTTGAEFSVLAVFADQVWRGGIYRGGVGSLAIGTANILNGVQWIAAPEAAQRPRTSFGTLNIGDMAVGYGGAFVVNHVGSRAVVCGDIIVGAQGGTGTWNLSGTGEVYARDLHVGGDGAGTFVQDGAGTTVNARSLYMAAAATGGPSTYTLQSGQLTIGEISIIGNLGNATFTQNGGTHSSGQITLGAESGSVGNYNLSGGEISVGGFIVGLSGGSMVQQNGGTVVATDLILGHDCASTGGTYTLYGGACSPDNLIVGKGGLGVFQHLGGAFVVGYGGGGEITIGSMGSTRNLDCEYMLNVAGTSTYAIQAGLVTVGDYGKGTFNHESGKAKFTTLVVGSKAEGVGIYRLFAGAQLESRDVAVGESGDGALDHNGAHTIAGTLSIGTGSLSDGQYDVKAGTLWANELKIGPHGRFHNWGDSIAQLGGVDSENIFTIFGGTVKNAGTSSRTHTHTGLFTWYQGTYEGPGTTNIQGTGHLVFGYYTGQASNHSLVNRTIENKSTTTWNSSSDPNALGAIVLSQGATFHNDTGALFEISGDADFSGAAGNKFINDGTIRKIAGNGVTTFAIEFQHGPMSQVIVDSGSIVITGPSVLPSYDTWVKGGPGVLIIGGAQSNGVDAQINVQAGILQMDTNAGSSTSRTLTLNVAGTSGSPATLVLNTTQHLNGIVVGSYGQATLSTNGASYIDTNELSVCGTGKLDLKDNDMIIRDGSAFQNVWNSIAAARNTGPILWQGNGITTSAFTNHTGLGVIVNDDGSGAALHPTFDGQGVDTDCVLVKYTWNGDANLDGLVNADDYYQIDVGGMLGLSGWYWGDFNYDGVINADDYFLIDGAYIGQSGTLSARNVAAVPEAGVLGVIVCLGGALILRGRRVISDGT